MKLKKKILITAVTFMSLACGTASFALAPSTISNIYVFGDSLSDCGVTDQLAIADHSNNTFTTPGGLTWSQQIGKDFGLKSPLVAPNGELLPNNDYKAYMAQNPGKMSDPGSVVSQTEEGTCYAAGGATTSGAGMGIPSVYTPPSVQNQVQNFLFKNPAADPNALYIIWGGANNILSLLKANDKNPADYSKASATAAADIATDVSHLKAAGAKHIVVIDLPDLSETALIQDQAKTDPVVIPMTHGVSINFNTGLNTALAGTGVLFYRVDALLHTIITTAPNTGTSIINVTGAACGDTTKDARFCVPPVGTDSDSYLFADGIHPTAAAHTIIAKDLETLIEASNF